MIGIVLVSHGDLAPEARRSLESVLGHSVPNVVAVHARADDTRTRLRDRLMDAVRTVEQGDGVMILTDMYGDSATNVSIDIASDARVRIVTGANMPIIIKAVSARATMELDALATFLVQYGRDHIVLGAGPGAPHGKPGTRS